MNKISLYQLEKGLKKFLGTFVITLSVGVALGLVYLNYTTDFSPEEAVSRFRGSEEIQAEDEFDIPENYARPVSELLITTHNHIIGFSFIFFLVGIIFYFNSVITGGWKMFLLIEPLISTVISFGSIWGMRFIHPSFVYLTLVSSTLIYISYLIMVSVILYEVFFKKTGHQKL